jgi:hypothetical protein
MTAKESFLNSLLNQIQTLQTAYEFNKSLPDSVFEGMIAVQQPSKNQTISKAIDKPSANVQRLPVYFGGGSMVNTTNQQSEYGINKRTLIKILEDEGKAMVKWNIQSRFAELLGKSTEEVLNTVTNTLATLKEDGTIEGYKPEGLKFKGQFWGLSEWFVNGFIKEQYSPFKNVTIL